MCFGLAHIHTLLTSIFRICLQSTPVVCRQVYLRLALSKDIQHVDKNLQDCIRADRLHRHSTFRIGCEQTRHMGTNWYRICSQHTQVSSVWHMAHYADKCISMAHGTLCRQVYQYGTWHTVQTSVSVWHTMQTSVSVWHMAHYADKCISMAHVTLCRQVYQYGTLCRQVYQYSTWHTMQTSVSGLLYS